MNKGFFETIVDENAWELAGEGVRKFDLIRWNLLSAKIDEFKESYRNAVNNGSYPAKIYYKFKEDNFTIDVTTIQLQRTCEGRLTLAPISSAERLQMPSRSNCLLICPVFRQGWTV